MIRKLKFILPVFFIALGLIPVCVNQSIALNQTAPSPVTQQTVNAQPLILYSLSDQTLNQPATKIPYYIKGDIHYFTKSQLDSHKTGGHSPWKDDPFLTVETIATNLIPNLPKDKYGNILMNVKTDNKNQIATYENGTIIKKISDNKKNALVQIIVPNFGTYDITLVSPKDAAGIYFIKEIRLTRIFQDMK
ncbi:hypothetical protein [Aneurinibacillus aneurinilyticus]|jgi:hypothetical protein|uniref:Uncharacterized protein n=1 Tax=Aneurinibacillus aneurinilyticus TaxID=1391 RepID=A0A848CPQ7_ANEAE|nr:hypothetical protein [Aneurinibacillus aneurinilyticus]NME97803.1 hypothetical protein [Aneurinibacillus aneurinilyticus]